jgi:hypothetical protein
MRTSVCASALVPMIPKADRGGWRSPTGAARTPAERARASTGSRSRPNKHSAPRPSLRPYKPISKRARTEPFLIPQLEKHSKHDRAQRGRSTIRNVPE